MRQQWLVSTWTCEKHLPLSNTTSLLTGESWIWWTINWLDSCAQRVTVNSFMSKCTDSLTRRTWGYWLMRRSIWPVNVHMQPQKSTAPWAASRGVWSEGWGRGLSPSALHQWNPTWNTASSSWVLSEEGHGPAVASSEKGHEDDVRARAPLLWR